ncbi:MAG: response regulator [Alcanivoracaceae bacterium]|nr:response regulator [Alcanivoracaceae bacterium]
MSIILSRKAVFVFFILAMNCSYAVVVKFNKLINSIDNTPIQVVKKILQDKNGYIWIATADAGLFKFNGNELESININNSSKPIEIVTMHIDVRNTLWIGTKNNGLICYDHGKIQRYQYKENDRNTIGSSSISTLIADKDSGLWIGTDNGLTFMSETRKFTRHPIVIDGVGTLTKPIKTLLWEDSETLLIGTSIGLFSLNSKTKKISRQKLSLNKGYLPVNVIHKDQFNTIWVGTHKGLFRKTATEKTFSQFKPKILKQVVFTITSDAFNIWVGTIYSGLFKISQNDSSINNYEYDSHINTSISDNIILSLFIDNSGILWIGTFNDGVNYLDLNTLNFGLETDSKNSISCSDNNVFYGFHQDLEKNLWVASQNGLIKFNKEKNICEFYGSVDHRNKSSSRTIVYDIIEYKDNMLWLPTARGLILFNKITGEMNGLNNNTKIRTYFAKKYRHDMLLLGTNQGLYKYTIKNNITAEIKLTNSQTEKLDFSDIAIDKNGAHILIGKGGVYKLSKDEKLSIYKKIQSQLPQTEIQSIFINNDNELWIGTAKHGLFHFDEKEKLLLHYSEKQGISKNITINSIEEDNNGNLWLGTDNGLKHINLATKETHTFRKSDGLQSNFFTKSSSYKTPSGKLIFGGRNGLNAFNPQDIIINTKAPKIALTELTRFGTPIKTGINYDDFILNKDISDLEELTLSHKDYVIGFEFAALDFADPSRNKYAYKMEGQDPDWNYVNADNRSISYSNLKSGNYTFKVRGSNKDGVWNNIGKSLKIKVLPAPWLSWWAMSLYILSTLLILWWFIHRKTKANAQLTNMLRQEVMKKTKTLQQKTDELQVQKQTVETLLTRKNELFANVSHEFRTPLTLILGPVNKLLKSKLCVSDINSLKMINRNANRLLTMIEQLLQLAKISDQQKITFNACNTHSHIEAIVDSFKPLASEKKIALELEKNDRGTIKVTKNALDIVLGNLLSNAVKYTPIGGRVTVSAETTKTQIFIQVKDSGPGLDAQQQIEIFNRFKRLDAHQNLEGVGIGLSVVKEVLKVNNATINIDSKVGFGSTFIVAFSTIDLDFEEPNDDSKHFLVRQLVNDTTNSVLSDQKDTHKGSKNNETILIIDDNQDMRVHIADTLKDNYYCLLAAAGKDGVALAIEHVPDVIICDVMMPRMDGFQVSRALRSDTRTSHIPLMLLTALDDKASRIRGWREHVDIYLTKPFDADELKLQLENILVIRNIIKKKAGKIIQTGKSSANTDLPKLDQEFVDKLNNIIMENYHNPLYLRPQMASDMAVSIKQLQRKIKALIDMNPMDLMRDYRLKQAAKSLKSGYQVSRVSDDCGFNSLSYFSQCFKAQYGFSPKKYQNICNQKTNE